MSIRRAATCWTTRRAVSISSARITTLRLRSVPTGSTTLRLRSRDEKVEGEIFLTVETASGRPQRVVYVLYEDRVDVKVTHLESVRRGVRRYDPKAYDGYETIDFR